MENKYIPDTCNVVCGQRLKPSKSTLEWTGINYSIYVQIYFSVKYR